MVDQGIKNLIISALTKGPCEASGLRSLLGNKKHFSKQAFYKALSKLVAEETVIKNGQLLSLSKQWILQRRKELDVITKSYAVNSFAQTALGLQEGERISYSIDSMKRLDLLLLENLHYVSEIIKPKAIALWSVHEFFLLARPKQSLAFLEDAKNRKILVLVAVEQPTILDKANQSKSIFDGKNTLFGVSCKNPLKQKDLFSINVVGDLIFEVRLGAKTLRAIERLYESKDTEAVHLEIQKILGIKDKHKIVIKRDGIMAKKLLEKIGDNFVIPTHYKKCF